jgi:hypothetical protein
LLYIRTLLGNLSDLIGKENSGVTDCGYTAVTYWVVVTCSLLVKIRVISLRHFYAILAWMYIEKYEIMIWLVMRKTRKNWIIEAFMEIWADMKYRCGF